MRDLVYIDSQEEFLYQKGHTADCSAPRSKDFILFSHDLSASGAPRVLHHIAKTLINEGHYVLVISAEYGPLQALH